MHTPTSHAERLVVLIELAREHDDDYSSVEVEQLQLAQRRFALRETRPAQPSAPLAQLARSRSSSVDAA
jgi:hypothetical protein